ncbi:unnamed protein product [Mycena citricolor]|uniref:Uncharacterized protein n=1 Tax=Mycena citricolor TaxID=2018698 RepID=A0AAD2K7B3_9AGAR|nr:unnamed protein product [Mycena citricolor]
MLVDEKNRIRVPTIFRDRKFLSRRFGSLPGLSTNDHKYIWSFLAPMHVPQCPPLSQKLLPSSELMNVARIGLEWPLAELRRSPISLLRMHEQG